MDNAVRQAWVYQVTGEGRASNKVWGSFEVEANAHWYAKHLHDTTGKRKRVVKALVDLGGQQYVK